tara:strand:+ start:553 stop:921 length:369 start_codon:yes stop_codon:yes gene_type:complete
VHFGNVGRFVAQRTLDRPIVFTLFFSPVGHAIQVKGVATGENYHFLAVAEDLTVLALTARLKRELANGTPRLRGSVRLIWKFCEVFPALLAECVLILVLHHLVRGARTAVRGPRQGEPREGR